MKIREGFVSNSSSTSFTFCFKGDKLQTLYEMIVKYSKYFELSMDEPYYFDKSKDTISCDAADVVKSIKAVVKANRKSKWYKIEVISLDDLIRKYQEILDSDTREFEREKKDPKNTNDEWSSIFYTQDIAHNKKLIQKVNRLKEKGLTHCVEIGFGDNHGDICGGDIGNLMDYEGRNISISNNEFAVFTIQNR